MTESFASRHIGPREADQHDMLSTLGFESMEALIDASIPAEIRLKKDINVPEALSEQQYLEHIKGLANENKVFKSHIGLGYYETFTPSVIKRNILENPGWYTAYTPYQAEISQGRLEALLNYQTAVVDLTGMEVANASLLDEGTAAAEAMIMFYNSRDRDAKKAGVSKFFVSELCFPQTIDILKTRSEPLGIELVIGNHEEFKVNNEFFGAIVQYPASNGEIYDYSKLASELKDINGHLAVAADILSLAILKSPGSWGADAVVGTTQRFGIPMGYGGPHAAYFATKESYKRHIPGRIIGVTRDASGKQALRMALQTREQHIKRDKATSNICTAQVLLAVMAGMYAVFHGKEGLQSMAHRVRSLTSNLQAYLQSIGIQTNNQDFFDTLTISMTQEEVESVRQLAEGDGLNFRYDNELIGISINETDDHENILAIANVFARFKNTKLTGEQVDQTNPSVLRNDDILSHPVFSEHRSETEIMRYIKRLEKKDLSLNFSMIPLGSCTMKLNAATQLLPLSWEEFGNIHPYAPTNQAAGYLKMIDRLADLLSEITGFDATSLQPNSGAQGEYAGLMVIRAYHKSRGDEHRNIALIPASAHGTNPASAVMAGMQVVVVKTDEAGNIDVNDLREKAELHKDNLAALMVTYPSTHGVFEKGIIEVNEIIHSHGGQVYMDGANMNAQVGLTSPAAIGADVCHLNLHKTFAIPHGGGGPGMGPICVAKHLSPFLPGNPLVETGGDQSITSISAAPFGSSLILIISYAYILTLGKNGLKKSTEVAILNANYIRQKLSSGYDILYSNENGMVGHEMIVDCRKFKQENGIEVTDIAKRLMDYGFHAPTVSFPVAGTLMIEPTESESQEELDRFIDAMLQIRAEIQSSSPNEEDNLLRNAPHILEEITSDQWNYPYSRKEAAFPLSWIADNKFWPSVKRTEDAYGDRHLICTCPSVEEYEELAV